jgi:hypothetical protein
MSQRHGSRSRPRRLSWRLVIVPIDLLLVHRPPPSLDKDGVPCSTTSLPPPPSPCRLYTARTRGAGELHPVVTMKHRRLRPAQRLLQGVTTKAPLAGPSHRPRHHVATAPIAPGPQRPQATPSSDRREVRTPDLRAAGDWHAAPPGGRHPRAQRWQARARFGSAWLEPHRRQQPRHPVMRHGLPGGLQPGGHPAHAIDGSPRVRFIQDAQHQEVLGTLPRGPLVTPGPCAPPESTRPGDADPRIIGRNHASCGVSGARPRVFSTRPTPR